MQSKDLPIIRREFSISGPERDQRSKSCAKSTRRRRWKLALRTSCIIRGFEKTVDSPPDITWIRVFPEISTISLLDSGLRIRLTRNFIMLSVHGSNTSG